MPVAEFDGRFGWGYDGVDLFAPTHLYGTPDDFRRFVDAAHAAGVGVILDVVYNHLGPVGQLPARVLRRRISPTATRTSGATRSTSTGPTPGRCASSSSRTPATGSTSFTSTACASTRRSRSTTASAEHILRGDRRARARAPRRARPIVIVAENEPQDTRLVRPVADGGYGLDALWNDDFHHSAMVALTGRAEAYYSDTRGEPQEFISAAKYGYLFQGQHYHWQRERRGARRRWGLPPAAFVAFLQNHDQVANSARGLRGHELTSPGRWRAMTALLLLLPGTPMLFQGQEFSASAPFLYFADFEPELAAAVRNGRGEFLTQFPSIVETRRRGGLADPGAPATFERCKLDFGERESHRGGVRAAPRSAAAPARGRRVLARRGPAASTAPCCRASAFVLRFFAPDHRDDRLLVVNLGAAI